MAHVSRVSAPVERPETLIQQSVFEGLFVHVLKPDAAFEAALLHVGFDVQHPQPQYPVRILKACLQVACRHVSPELPEAEAMRQLGRRFLDGFLETLAGRAFRLLLPVLGAEGCLRRLHPYFSLGAHGTELASYREGPREWTVIVRGTAPLADFNAGLLASVLERTGASPQVTVLERGETRAVIRLRW